MAVRVFQLGGIGNPCCCGCSTTTITNQFCGFNLVGFTVNAIQSGVAVATGTTDSSGNVSFSLASGTYQIQLIGAQGLPTQTANRVISCSGGSITIGWPNADNLTITDPNGTWTLTYQGSATFLWLACYTEPGTGEGTYTGAAGGTCASNAGTGYDVSYSLSCAGGMWSLIQTIGFCFYMPVHPVTCIPILCSNGFNTNCTTISPACPSGGTTGTLTETTWSLPFNVAIASGTLATCSGNSLANPISGTMTVDT
jgi:hypothetical protein